MLARELSSAVVAARLARGYSRRDVEDATGVDLVPIEVRRGYMRAADFARLWAYLSADPSRPTEGGRP